MFLFLRFLLLFSLFSLFSFLLLLLLLLQLATELIFAIWIFLLSYRRCFLVFLNHLGQKNTANTSASFTLQKLTKYLPMPRKRYRYLLSFHHVARCSFYILYAKKVKTRYFAMFLLPERSPKSTRNGSKRSKINVQNHPLVSASSFQNVKTPSSVKNFEWWSAGGARPRVAKLSCWLHTSYGQHRWILKA